jgi:type IV pilus assembly protein PilE
MKPGGKTVNSRRSKGFTLVEMLVVLSIIGVLAAIAWPGYQSYYIRISREAAKTELLQLSNTQEKIYLNGNAYTANVTTAYNGRANGGLGIASGRTSDGKYALSIAAGAGAAYTIRATPVAGKSQVGDGIITISSDGTRMWGAATW